MNQMQEIEAKFYVRDLDRIATRLHELKARLIQPRLLESNLRFDLPDSRLRSEGRVLRLRKDSEARLTYKDSGKSEEGVLHRTEIEFTVEDFEKAKLFLEALGYQKLFEYEKYRTTYSLDSGSVAVAPWRHLLPETQKLASGFHSCHIMLDELPYGNFVEIEGEPVAAIQGVAEKFGLDWSTSIPTSYSVLFERVQKTLRLDFSDLTFANFEGIRVSAEHLHVQPADASASQKV
jgi:adenylate cyclase class 2